MPTKPEVIFSKQKANRWNLAATNAATRIAKLKLLEKNILTHEELLVDAIYQDFKKPAQEVEVTEIYPVLEEIRFAVKNLSVWMKPLSVPTPIPLFGSRSEVRYEPKGMVLIMSPWNYPFQLLMSPLVAAVAAGNAVIARPSNKTAHTAKVIQQIIEATFPENEVAAIICDSKVADQLLDLPFDHIFFTGSSRIGQKVMMSAVRHLGSVTLELGGKSPCIIDQDVDLDDVVPKLVWAKYLNAGQTCVAPDYVFVHANIAKQFLAKVKERIQFCFGETEELQLQSTHLAALIDDASFTRVQQLTQASIQQGAELVTGLKNDKTQRMMAPTVLGQVKPTQAIMSEEIFGPVMPVMEYSDIQEVYNYVQSQPKPLALYVFSNSKTFTEQVINNTSAGGTVTNHAIIHLGNPHLPFGGIGFSGQGNYHGFYGFKTFSHERAVLHQGDISFTTWLFPPYGKKAKRLMQFVRHFLM